MTASAIAFLRCEPCSGEGGHEIDHPCGCPGYSGAEGCFHDTTELVVCSDCEGTGYQLCACGDNAVGLDAENEARCAECLPGVSAATESVTADRLRARGGKGALRNPRRKDANRGPKAPAQTEESVR